MAGLCPTLPSSPFNETHFDNPRYNALYKEAVSTLDVAKQTDMTEPRHVVEIRA